MVNSSFKISDLVSGVAPVKGAGATIYSTYDGSLTTPGCNEVVHWINFLTPLHISVRQLAMLRFEIVIDYVDYDYLFCLTNSAEHWTMLMVTILWTTSDRLSL